MKTILILVIASVLIFASGCNYEYGNYGKDKTDKKTTQSDSGTETPTSTD